MKIFSPWVKSKQTKQVVVVFVYRTRRRWCWLLIWVTTQGTSVSSDGSNSQLCRRRWASATQSESHCFPIEGPFECIWIVYNIHACSSGQGGFVAWISIAAWCKWAEESIHLHSANATSCQDKESCCQFREWKQNSHWIVLKEISLRAKSKSGESKKLSLEIMKMLIWG